MKKIEINLDPTIIQAVYSTIKGTDTTIEQYIEMALLEHIIQHRNREKQYQELKEFFGEA